MGFFRCTVCTVGGFLAILVFGAFGVFGARLSAEESRVTYKLQSEGESNGRVTVSVDGSFFAEYRPDFRGTPIIWPICTAEGTLVSRGFPMTDGADPLDEPNPELRNILENGILGDGTAKKDHPHHRSLWFTHGNLNGVDFWALNRGTIRQQSEAVLVGAPVPPNAVRVITQNVWGRPESEEVVAEDTRTITFGVLPDSTIRYIDYDILLTAVTETMTLGDTKEGTFGFRVTGSMDGEASNRNPRWGGTILNSEGDTDGETWGKRASWVDYTGPAPKRLSAAELATNPDVTADDFPLVTTGVVIMNHPTSFRYPSWYHVRTYGLFAVNPFGIHDFDPAVEEARPVEVPRGESLSFRYRVLFHDGILPPENIDEFFGQYSKIP